MAANSAIEWTDATWNPVVGCSLVSPGCAHCYAMKIAWRVAHAPGSKFKGTAWRPAKADGSLAPPVWTGLVKLDEVSLASPLHWRSPRRIFVNSMSDLFHEALSDADIDRVFAVMALCPQHTFQVLTKRPLRMRDYMTSAGERVHEIVCDWTIEQELDVILIAPGIDETRAPPGKRVYLGRWPLPNVWLGTSVEDQERAEQRIPYLLETPAAVRFLSCEPLLGPVDLRQWLFDYGCGCGWGGQPLDYCNNCGWRGEAPGEIGEAKCSDCGEQLSDYNACPECGNHDGGESSFGPNGNRLHWVICGGESGPNARPMHPDWARSLRDQCAAAGVPFFFKQWGEWAPFDGRPGALELARMQCAPLGTWWPEGDTFRFGKKYTGRRLDGREHNDYPTAQPKEIA